MMKYLYDIPQINRTIVDHTKPDQSEPCDTCQIENCEFAPNGENCINRRSIIASSDLYNCDWERDNHDEIVERQLQAERDFLNLEHTVNW